MGKNVPAYVFCFFLISVISPLAGQSLAPDLDRVSNSVENYIRQKRPKWKHEMVPPATPPGSQPSPNVGGAEQLFLLR
jgi:hypothetical protein